ncbi:ABC transporter substrate-binding protein [Paenibacillus sp. NPDC058071]|uniref:ABC transporter substrate-binding protein n=1 Tax=Paenibacillus sp. NPDC058071 TaxID=3346326 RepID=UPI0036DEB22E
MNNKQIVMTGLAALLTTALLSGCTGTEKAESSKLKVMYFDEYSFNMEYGSLFQSKYPNIELEMVHLNRMEINPDDTKAYADFVEREKPDVLLLNPAQYKIMLREGKLVALDGMIKKSKYSLDSMHAGVLGMLRSIGDGDLYGLAPTFSSNALFYNKDLFDRYQIEPPHDQMTWEEVLALADRFPSDGEGEERVYGLTLLPWESTPSGLLSRMDTTDGLKWYDPVQRTVKLNSERQKLNAERSITSFQKGSVYYIDFEGQMIDFDVMKKSPFVTGKAAMMLGNFTDFLSMDAFISESQPSMNWAIVTEPVSAEDPDRSVGLRIEDIFAINAASPNEKAAWEFIRFASGEENAKLKSKNSYKLLSRTDQFKEWNGHDLTAFYKLKTSGSDLFPTDLPGSFYQALNSLKSKELNEAFDGNKSAGDALDAVQQEAQLLLNTIPPEQKSE